MSIYRNGKTATAAANRKAPLPTTAACLVMGRGCSAHCLRPSLWSKELWASGSDFWLGRSASGGEEACTACGASLTGPPPIAAPRRMAVWMVLVLQPLSLDGSARVELIGNLPAPGSKPAQTSIVNPSVLTLSGSNAAVAACASQPALGQRDQHLERLKGASSLPRLSLGDLGLPAPRGRSVEHPPAVERWGLCFDCGSPDSNTFDRLSQPMTPQVMKGVDSLGVHQNATTGEMNLLQRHAVGERYWQDTTACRGQVVRARSHVRQSRLAPVLARSGGRAERLEQGTQSSRVLGNKIAR